MKTRMVRRKTRRRMAEPLLLACLAALLMLIGRPTAPLTDIVAADVPVEGYRPQTSGVVEPYGIRDPRVRDRKAPVRQWAMGDHDGTGSRTGSSP